MAALAIVPIIGKILDRILPDKTANDAAKAQLAQMQIAGELSQVIGQLDIDKTEAASASVLVAGWRPAIGWVCCLGLFSQFIVRPLFNWIAILFHRTDLTFPSLDLSTLMTLIFAMLGIGVHQKLTDGTNGS